METLKFIGRGSAFNFKEGNTSAYTIRNNELILFDCGESVFKEIITRNILDNSIKNVHIFITHLHSDHSGSLSGLIFYCYFILKKIPIVYFKNKILIKNFLNIQSVPTKCYNIIEIKDYVDIKDVSIKAIEVLHDKNMESYGYLLSFKNSNNKIFYSGDSCDITFYTKHDILKENIICYQDVCLLDYPGNIHLNINKLCDYVDITSRKNIYCMHIDSDELINVAEELGFNVAK